MDELPLLLDQACLINVCVYVCGDGGCWSCGKSIDYTTAEEFFFFVYNETGKSAVKVLLYESRLTPGQLI